MARIKIEDLKPAKLSDEDIQRVTGGGRATPKLLQACADGQHASYGDGGEQTYLAIKLENVQ